jgi:hypothetical protein
MVELDLDPATPTREQLLAVVDQMQRDWVTLNTFLNATACSFGWCEEYEERLDVYNGYFEVLKLEPRPRRDIGKAGGRYLIPNLDRLSIRKLLFPEVRE